MESHTNDPCHGIDLSQYRLDVIQHQSFLEYLWHHLKPQLEKKDEKEPFTCLEVGCGNGVFAKLLHNRVEEHRFSRSLQYTAIDPINDCVKRAKEMGINAFESDFFSFVEGKEKRSYDMILFTKSLHHVLPVDKAVALASSCLKENGVLVADEFDRNIMDEETARWFFETCDMLEAADVLHMKKVTYHMHVHQDAPHHDAPHQETHSPSHSHSHSHSHGHEHNHHEHHEHQPQNATPEPQDNNTRFLQKMRAIFMKHDPPLGTWAEIQHAIKHNFEAFHVTDKFPYLYNIFVPRLVISEAGEKVLKTLMKIEEERIQDKHLIPIGARIIATHRKGE